MGFGSGSGDDPFAEEEETGEKTEETTAGEPQEQAITMDAGSPAVGDDTPGERSHGRRSNGDGRSTVNDRTETDDSPRTTAIPTGFSEVDVTDHYTTQELARMLMAREYHEERPRVPYATWRNGTSTGRSRTTIELNPEVDDLVKEAMREFEDRYHAEINKADLREFALVYGLMHADEVFEMAEEWGLQYNG